MQLAELAPNYMVWPKTITAIVTTTTAPGQQQAHRNVAMIQKSIHTHAGLGLGLGFGLYLCRCLSVSASGLCLCLCLCLWSLPPPLLLPPCPVKSLQSKAKMWQVASGKLLFCWSFRPAPRDTFDCIRMSAVLNGKSKPK